MGKHNVIRYFIIFTIIISVIELIFIMHSKPVEKPTIRNMVSATQNEINTDIITSNEIKINSESKKEVSKKDKSQESKVRNPEQNPVIGETQSNIHIVNINTVTYEELMTVPEMNEHIAQGIIELRNQISYFSNIYELLYVDGMTQDKLSKMIEYLTLE